MNLKNILSLCFVFLLIMGNTEERGTRARGRGMGGSNRFTRKGIAGFGSGIAKGIQQLFYGEEKEGVKNVQASSKKAKSQDSDELYLTLFTFGVVVLTISTYLCCFNQDANSRNNPTEKMKKERGDQVSKKARENKKKDDASHEVLKFIVDHGVHPEMNTKMRLYKEHYKNKKTR